MTGLRSGTGFPLVSTKNSLPLLRVGYRGRGVLALHLAIALVVDEEEQLVFANGSAQRTAKLVADQHRHLTLPVSTLSGGRKGPNRIQVGVAVVLPYPAMKLVGAAVDRDVDHRTGSAAKFRTIVIGFDAKLVDRIRRRRNRLVGKSLVRSAVGVVVQSVEQKVVEFRPLPVDVK